MPTSFAPDRLERAAAVLRHDVGKHVTFAVRFLGGEADDAALRLALREDLLQTHSSPAGVASVDDVWGRLAPELRAAASGAPAELVGSIEAIGDRVLALAAEARCLEELDGTRLRQLADRAAELAELTRVFHRLTLTLRE